MVLISLNQSPWVWPKYCCCCWNDLTRDLWTRWQVQVGSNAQHYSPRPLVAFLQKILSGNSCRTSQMQQPDLWNLNVPPGPKISKFQFKLTLLPSACWERAPLPFGKALAGPEAPPAPRPSCLGAPSSHSRAPAWHAPWPGARFYRNVKHANGKFRIEASTSFAFWGSFSD